MSNILIEAESLGPTVQLMETKLLAVEKFYDIHVMVKPSTELTKADIFWSDIVMAIRSQSQLDVDIAKYARQAGRFHILVIDDDFLGIAKSYNFYPQRNLALRKALNNTDVLLTVNPILSAKYSAIGMNHRTAHTDTLVPNESIVERIANEERTGKIKIAYYVNDGSCRWFDTYIRPILNELCDRYCNKISLTLFALHPEMSEYADRMEINYIGHVSYKEFKQLLAEGHYDIGLAPVDDDGGFSSCKYFNKFIEYSKAGIAAIYSNCPPYTFVVKDGENGLMCDNTPQVWLSALAKLISDAELRASIVMNAQRTLRERFSTDNIAKALVAQIPELVTHRADKSVGFAGVWAFKLKHYWFRFQEYSYFVLYHLRHDGVHDNINRLRKRILRKVRR